MRNLVITALLAGLLCATAAEAADNPGGMYLSFDIGGSSSRAEAGRYDGIAAGAVGGGASVLESRLDGRESGWSLALWGVQGAHFGVELSRLKLDVLSYEAMVQAPDGAEPAQVPVEISVRSHGWAATAVGIAPVTDALHLEGRAGLYQGRSGTRVMFPYEDGGSVRFSRSNSSTSPMLGVGLVYSPPRAPFGLTAGYTWFANVAGKPLGRLSFGVRLWVERGSR